MRIVRTSLTTEENITIVWDITYNGKQYHLQDKETPLTREGVIGIVRNVASNSKGHHLQ
jgi:hypothetical protein